MRKVDDQPDLLREGRDQKHALMDVEEELPELIFEPNVRYLSLHGSCIDQLGFQPHELVTATFKLNQQIRDRYHHHVTVFNHLDIRTLIPVSEGEDDVQQKPSGKQKKKLHQKTMYRTCRAITEQFGTASSWTKPIDLGLGVCRENDAVTYFRVLYWPFGQLIRQFMGLGPSNFHITVGFEPRDVHLYKGPATLLCLQEGQFCTTKQMDRLVDYAIHYSKDWEFIKKLYQTCWRHGYYRQVIRLARILTVCRKFQVCQ